MKVFVLVCHLHNEWCLFTACFQLVINSPQECRATVCISGCPQEECTLSKYEDLPHLLIEYYPMEGHCVCMVSYFPPLYCKLQASFEDVHTCERHLTMLLKSSL